MECSIIQILRSIEGAAVEFRTLGEVEFRRGDDGELLYMVGSSALIFKISINGAWHGLKCYTSTVERHKAIYQDRLLQRELYIPSSDQGGVWLDVLLYPWVEGETLVRYIERNVEQGNTPLLEQLSKRFDALALSMLQSEDAHGDITAENIIIDSTGELHLIDFDTAFTPALANMRSIGLGTQAYQHPKRTPFDYNRDIDDYSLALISTALSLIAIDHTIYNRFSNIDGLLFDPAEILGGQRYELFDVALETLATSGRALDYRIAQLLKSGSVALPPLQHLIRHKVEGLHTEVRPTTAHYRNGTWGYLNEFGREVIPPIFDTAFDFHESLAAVQIGKAWHYIDRIGNVAINCSQYDALKSVRNGVARAKRDGVWLELHV